MNRRMQKGVDHRALEEQVRPYQVNFKADALLPCSQLSSRITARKDGARDH